MLSKQRVHEWSDRDAYIAWAYVANPAQHDVNRLIESHGPRGALIGVLTGKLTLRNSSAIIARWQRTDFTCEYENTAKAGIQVLARSDPMWPAALKVLAQSEPWALWLRGSGDLETLLQKCVAIVGARACTAYGSHVAQTWSAELAGSGVTVISGGAFGVDAAAHRGALVTGSTICITAGGVDVPYPRAHEDLFAQMTPQGIIMSETPPGEHVRRERFLSRNRLIAALAHVTVVVEAAERSGSLNTARLAAEMNRHVIAIPGPIHSRLSSGCHALIREHAAVLGSSLTDVRELLDPMGAFAVLGAPEDPSDFRTWSPSERAVFDALDRQRPLDGGELMAIAGLPPDEIEHGLAGLLSREVIVRDLQGWSLR